MPLGKADLLSPLGYWLSQDTPTHNLQGFSGVPRFKQALWIVGPVKGSGDQFHQVRELVLPIG